MPLFFLFFFKKNFFNLIFSVTLVLKIRIKIESCEPCGRRHAVSIACFRVTIKKNNCLFQSKKWSFGYLKKNIWEEENHIYTKGKMAEIGRHWNPINVIISLDKQGACTLELSIYDDEAPHIVIIVLTEWVASYEVKTIQQTTRY